MTIYAQPVNQYAGSVQDLWEKLIPRLNLGQYSVGFLDSCQEVMELVTERLWFRKSDLLIAEYSYTLPQGSSTVALPPEFLAMQYYPYLQNTDTDEVVILSNIHESRKLDYLGEDRTRYYELANTNINIFPPTDREYTLMVKVYSKPPPLVSMTDTMPFNGLFSQLIGDYAVRISNVGLGLLADPTFTAALSEKLDKMMNLRNTKNIYWKQTRTSRQYLYNNINPDYF